MADTIKVPEKTRKSLCELAQKRSALIRQAQDSGTTMQVIAQAVLDGAGAEGDYNLSADCSTLTLKNEDEE